MKEKCKKTKRENNKGIVCIKVSTTSQKYHALHLAKPPLESAKCPSLPFSQSPLYIRNSPLKVEFFSENSKY